MTREELNQILEYAIRAPSTHNSQPWLFRLSENSVEVFYNPRVRLPHADSEGRDMYISFGCMLENMSIAAFELGYSTTINYDSSESEKKVATVVFAQLSQEKPSYVKNLFDVIPKRVNARGMFISESFPNHVLDEMQKLNDFSTVNLHFISDKTNIKKVAHLTGQSIIDAYKSKGFRHEMSNWMNSNLSKKREGLPGYSLKMPLVISLIIPFLIRYFNIGKLLSIKNIEAISSAPLIIVFSGENNPKVWMDTGRLAERLMLYLQSAGYQTSIYVGSIEIGDRYKEVQKIINSKDRPLFIFTAGHIPGKHRITPRYLLSDKIVV